MKSLADKYFSRVKVERAFFAPWEGLRGYNPATIELVVPSEMVEEYARKIGDEDPSAKLFWYQSGLVKKIEENCNTSDLREVLSFLKVDVLANWEKKGKDYILKVVEN